MANRKEWTTPKLRPIEFTAASDDPLWLCACSLNDVQSLIEQPYQWQDATNAAHNTNIQLADYFVMQIGLAAEISSALPGTHAQENEDQINEALQNIPFDGTEYIVQGINGTPVILIRPNARHSLVNSWDGYWKEWGDPTKTDLAVAKGLGQGFGHLQIAKAGIPSSERADRILGFLMMAAKDGALTTTNDPYVNLMLRLTPSDVKDIDPTSGLTTHEPKPTGGFPRQFSDLTMTQASQAKLSFIGRKADFNHDAKLDDPPTPIPACDDMAGTIVNDQILLDTVIVKSYDPTITGG